MEQMVRNKIIKVGTLRGSGSSERDEEPGKGGGGIGTRRNGTNWSAETTRTIGIANGRLYNYFRS